jgi:hypothetical protein
VICIEIQTGLKLELFKKIIKNLAINFLKEKNLKLVNAFAPGYREQSVKRRALHV